MSEPNEQLKAAVRARARSHELVDDGENEHAWEAIVEAWQVSQAPRACGVACSLASGGALETAWEVLEEHEL